MQTLPPPPPPLPSPPPGPYPPSPSRERRAGELTTGWRAAFGAGWAGVVVGYASVWKSARTLGISTWWLGSSSEPNLVVVQLLPFVLPVLMVVGATRGLRWLPLAGLVAAAVSLAVAVPDLNRFESLALVELALAVAGALVSVASFAGLLRAVPVDAGEAPPPAAAR